MKYSATVELPRCWKNLVEMEFPEDLKGILDEKTNHTGNADPKPHYDDCRRVSGVFPNGADFSVELCSGQSNYYGGLSIFKDDKEVCSEFLENFNSLVWEGNGVEYELKIEWI